LVSFLTNIIIIIIKLHFVNLDLKSFTMLCVNYAASSMRILCLFNWPSCRITTLYFVENNFSLQRSLSNICDRMLTFCWQFVASCAPLGITKRTLLLSQEYCHCNKKLACNRAFLFDFWVTLQVLSSRVDNTTRWSLFTVLDRVTNLRRMTTHVVLYNKLCG